MIIGVPTEIKNNESRVSATPGAVSEFVKNNHEVYVQKGAGLGSGITDEEYVEAGATILDTAEEVWDKAELIYKVKEPIESEYKYFKEGQIIYTYLHLSADPELTKQLVDKKVTGIAFETVQKGRLLPLLKPMSEVAGRMAVQEGAKFLLKTNGGKGKLLNGVPGVAPAYVVVIGAGTVGSAATKIAVGMGARVKVLDVNVEALARLEEIHGSKIETEYSNPLNIEKAVKDADLVVSTVLIPGRKAPQLVKEHMVKEMEPGSVIVDVAIDQGGSTDITKGHPTTHDDPVFVEHDVIHYSVANMPGAAALTATYALSNATTRYGVQIANLGALEAAKKFPELIPGINTHDGYVTLEGVADDLGYEYKDLGLK